MILSHAVVPRVRGGHPGRCRRARAGASDVGAEAGARRDPRIARRGRCRPDVHGRRRRRAARRRRQRHRCRRCVHLRCRGRRDLAFRPRRRGSNHCLFGARSKGDGHQRAGSGAARGDARNVRGQGRDSRQRAAGRHRAGGCRLRVGRARALRHQVALRRAGAGDRARRRLPDVRVPAPLSRDGAAGVRAVRLDDEHVLSEWPDHAGGRDVPPAEPRGDAAR